MGPIFDRREAVMGPTPWRRTVCERVGERWCDGAGCMLILGIRSHRCMLAWGGCDPIFDRRETVMGPAQPSSRNLEENEDYRGLLLKDRFGGLPVNDEHVQRPMHARTPTVRVELEQRISTFGVAP